jgi:hypothetical protein
VLREWMKERVSPLTIFREIRAHLPDALLTLRQIPQIVQTSIREAAEGGGPTVDSELAGLRAEIHAAALRRDLWLAAGVLWLSGLIWLALLTQYRWLGAVQMIAAILLFLRQSFRQRIE